MRDVTHMLKAIHAQETLEAAREKAQAVVQKLRGMRLKEAAKKVEDGIEETLTYYAFPSEHWLKIRTNKHAGAAEPRNSQTHASGRNLPGWRIGVDAGLCKAEARRWYPVGRKALYEYEIAGTDGSGKTRSRRL